VICMMLLMRPRFPCLLSLFFVTAVAVVPSRNAAAQFPFGYRSYYGPATAASLEIQAEAQYLRAYGLAQRDLAVAAKHYEEAQTLALANAKQALHDHLERRELLEAEHNRKIAKRLKGKRESDQRILERLKNHPELNGGEVRTGVALNFLKNRLSPTVVTFRSASMGSREAVEEVAAQLHVTPETVHALQVRQNLSKGETFVFRLDEGRPMQVDWWPPALRAPELKDARSQFEAARTMALETQSSDDFDVCIRKLILRHAALEEAFLKMQNRATRLKSQQAWVACNDGKAFLQTMSGEIRRMEKLGPGRFVPEELRYQGSELPELLAHMVRNGLEFAPAKPDDEQAYHQVFIMLRDLYVAFESDAAQNEPATKAVIPK
jgi:hypothetical protein